MESKKVYAYYFPNWHVDEKNEKWHGKGWTEWNLTKAATPRFEGHVQPKIPLWGYEDESDPKVMEKKIAAAKEYGLDGFIFDWYWHTDGPYLKRCLEEGFLQAKNNQDLEFAVMWCNHAWMPIHPAAKFGNQESCAESTATAERFYELTQYCIDHYFGLPNYMKVDGKAYFSLYLPLDFMKELGKEGTAEAIRDFKARAVAAGHPGVHFNISAGFWYRDIMSNVQILNTEEINEVLDIMDVDSISTYGWDQPETFPTYEYIEALQLACDKYVDRCDVKKPVIPTVVNGWDPSPRTVQTDTYEPVGYPFTPIGIHNTPEVFEQSLEKIHELAVEHHAPFMTVTAWNEWTEGNYLEPCAEYGYGMLEALKRFKENQKR